MLSDNPVEYLSGEEVQQDNPGNRTTFKIVVVNWWELEVEQLHNQYQSVYFLFHVPPSQSQDKDEIDNCSLMEQLETAASSLKI